MELELDVSKMERWAEAISVRIVDEWDGANAFDEDAEMLSKMIKAMLINNPEYLQRLIGSGVIEEDFFEDLD